MSGVMSPAKVEDGGAVAYTELELSEEARGWAWVTIHSDNPRGDHFVVKSLAGRTVRVIITTVD
jgi:hypothetical protein